ncbi:MAG TPA: SRPBCC domain-containing protein [Caldisericia bacterium]|nr:SRPBCC domain-containing protein [Caldisericia bacterium]HPF49633.1 SRPBCC domain-containing protein [Caldisericia bacterium]HPI84615.1 SRPBCC domain-containing protein [Caldisericia bacterium]HPQ92175.1 SRPBCC domain-containing protein [Caldisericia bacterium]HRV74727.1 SRPBCC domain-containing protein [Caldisericia bacterium]
MEKSLTGSIEINAPVCEVWDAWTTKEGIGKFLAPDCNIEIKPGGKFEIYFDIDEEYGRRGTEGMIVMAVQKPKMLSFTWNSPPHLEKTRDQMTHVCLRFEEISDSKTKLTLTQDGWGEGDVWDEAFNYFKRAWFDIVFPELKKSLESVTG